MLGASQGFSYIGAAAIWDQADVVLRRSVDKCLNFILLLGKHDQVGNASKARMLDCVHLFLRMAMSMPQSNQRIRRDLVIFEEESNCFLKFGRFDGIRNHRRK